MFTTMIIAAVLIGAVIGALYGRQRRIATLRVLRFVGAHEAAVTTLEIHRALEIDIPRVHDLLDELERATLVVSDHRPPTRPNRTHPVRWVRFNRWPSLEARPRSGPEGTES